MNVREIIKAYLNTNGFDGLCTDGCGCGKDDLFPCYEDVTSCIPAIRITCEECGVPPKSCPYELSRYDLMGCYQSRPTEEKME